MAVAGAFEYLGVVQKALELADAALEHPLLALGLAVAKVLAQVAFPNGLP